MWLLMSGLIKYCSLFVWFVDFDPNIIFQSFFGGPGGGFSGFQQAGFPGGSSFSFSFG